MKKLILILTFIYSFPVMVNAFEVTGFVEIMENDSKTTVYLMSAELGSLGDEWIATDIIDTCVVENGHFHFVAPDTEDVKMYRISTAKSFLYYFANTSQDLLNLNIERGDSYSDFNVTYPAIEKDKELDKTLKQQLLRGVLNENLSAELKEFTLAHPNYVYQTFTSYVNTITPNPYTRREAINFLKKHINSPATPYLLALYSSTIPCRYSSEPLLSYKQLSEFMDIMPNSFTKSIYFGDLQKHFNQLKENYKEPKNGFVINGYTTQICNSYAVLLMPSVDNPADCRPVDTVKITNGYFTFTGSVPQPLYCSVKVGSSVFQKNFFLENTDIELNVNTSRSGVSFNNGFLKSRIWESSTDTYVNGSKSNDEWEQLTQEAYKGALAITDWVREHSKSRVTTFFLARNSHYTTVEQMHNIMSILDSSLHDTAEYKMLKSSFTTFSQTAKGVEAPNFTLKDLNNKKVSLSDFRGRFVLLDFWATWCGPCMAEMPNIKEAYESFSKDDLVVIGLSSDTDLDKWRKVASKKEWIQLIEGKSGVGNDYNVVGIPAIFLIDREGKFYAKGLRGKEIISEITKAIEEQKR